jgi:hypothetical protein
VAKLVAVYSCEKGEEKRREEKKILVFFSSTKRVERERSPACMTSWHGRRWMGN